MPGGVAECDRRALRNAEQRKGFDAQRVDDRLEILDPGLEGNAFDVTVGQAVTARVVTHVEIGAAQLGDPVPADEVEWIHLDVREPGRGAHQRRSLADGGDRETHAVGAGAEADFLLPFHRGGL